MKNCTCCITGHRTIQGMTQDTCKEALRNAVAQAIAQGYTHFISGFADGVDLLFAEIVVEFKAAHCLTLEAAIPHRGRLDTKKKSFQTLLAQCDKVSVTAQTYYKACFLARNRQMIDASSLLIAVYDGRTTGGTAYTVDYAKKVGCAVLLISC